MTTEPSVELYQSSDGIVLDVRGDPETVWLSTDQLAALFGRDASTISRHVRGVIADGELSRESVVADFATTAEDGRTSRVRHYNLDVIISVGYRVKSSEGVRFRQWAASVLRRYVVEGAALDERRLEQLAQIVQVPGRSGDEEIAGVAEVLTGYLPSLRVLRDYDEGLLDDQPNGDEPTWTLTYDDARGVIDAIRDEFPHDTLFGAERGDGLRAVVATIYQGFAGHELYPTVQAKAANLLYLIVKDHPLSDGNKRSAAALFVHFLAHNGQLRDAVGRSRITNNALAAITLMVAMSDPKEKETMIALLQRMLLEDAA